MACLELVKRNRRLLDAGMQAWESGMTRTAGSEWRTTRLCECLLPSKCAAKGADELVFARLGGNVRSSVYNYAPRTPRSPRSPHSRQRSSCPSSPSTPRYLSQSNSLRRSSSAVRMRKAPPPPLDLSKVSSFNLRSAAAKADTAKSKGSKRKAAPHMPEQAIVGKASRILLNPLERELHSRAAAAAAAAEGKLSVQEKQDGQGQSVVRSTLRGILRSVRSISNLKGANDGH